MNIIGIIPARMASSRFPGKPLEKILGMPMIGHVYFRSAMCPSLKEVYVAGCDREVEEYMASIGGKYILTKDTHERASDRTAEAMLSIEKKTGKRVDILVMIQGDEPMLHPEMIEEALKPMIDDNTTNVVNLMAPLKTREEHNDPNEVKVVTDLHENALYFSREPIPSWRKGASSVPMMKQVCIIPFRRDFLITFNSLTSTPLEKVESVDMLRVLEHGYQVKMVLSTFDTYSVDTPEDLRKVEQLIGSDSLIKSYCT
ncbi:MAG: 3-deoxy-manno-octulosonate cytidylyltransferase [Candidatus Eremiobacteraeota bacterium]|nr:3-deoxy-manno-octulosonate cytidylyltransferase [Candidatus Eremiobacteraeota bacterium]